MDFATTRRAGRTFSSSGADVRPRDVRRAAITLDDIGFFHSVNVYFCCRHASITDGAFVAESGRSIHGSSSSVLGEAAQYRTEGERRRSTSSASAFASRSIGISRFHLANRPRYISRARMAAGCVIVRPQLRYRGSPITEQRMSLLV